MYNAWKIWTQIDKELRNGIDNFGKLSIVLYVEFCIL